MIRKGWLFVVNSVEYKGVIPEDSDILCPWCKVDNKVLIWDETTKAECYSREMRKKYLGLVNVKAFNPNAKVHWYKCPKCGIWSKGSQLRIINNMELKRLGGEPVARKLK